MAATASQDATDSSPKTGDSLETAASPRVTRALVSVSDKTGLAEFARGLAEAGVEILSTGGSRRALEDAGVPVQDVTEYTGFPEMMDGRLKTLHPLVHGGILARRDHDGDMQAAEAHGITPIELVVVNLYPFRETIAGPDVTDAEAIEKIDIGGPTMVRAAAKNHAYVTIASAPNQYDAILQQVKANGATTPELRRELAAAAFAHTAEYDAAIAGYFEKETLGVGREALGERGCDSGEDDKAPATVTLNLTKKNSLRYGENPHQSAALYITDKAGPHSLVNAEQLNGKELSYNNLLDLDAAMGVARSLPKPGVAVLKHNNPCGAATGANLGEAMQRAWDGDPVSAFGSILGFNVEVDAAAAEVLAEPGKFVEAIVAPGFSADALEILTTKPKWRKNVRLLRTGELPSGQGKPQFRQIDGGFLAQNADDQPDEPDAWQVVTDSKPTLAQMADLRFAWAACRHVKSNAIVLASGGALVGVGAGQMSRVDSVEISIRKAGDKARGAVLASDAFFPFPDSIESAAAAGVVAFIQPGGSKGDEAVIAACNAHNLPMVFTGKRHFRH